MLIKIDKQIPDTSGLVNITVLNSKISEVENSIPDTINLVTATVLIQKLVKLRIKFLIVLKILLLRNLISLKFYRKFYSKINAVQFNQENGFDVKLTRFDKQITSNKIKHLEVQEETK